MNEDFGLTCKRRKQEITIKLNELQWNHVKLLHKNPVKIKKCSIKEIKQEKQIKY